MRISDWSSDVCSSDLMGGRTGALGRRTHRPAQQRQAAPPRRRSDLRRQVAHVIGEEIRIAVTVHQGPLQLHTGEPVKALGHIGKVCGDLRSEEHTSELQSLMRISYAVFCLKTKK